MEKSCSPSLPSSGGTSATTDNSSTSSIAHSSTSSNTDRIAGTGGSNSVAIHNALRQLNKSSFKISKPASKQCCAGGGSGGAGNPSHDKPETPPLPPLAGSPAAAPQQPPPPPSQPQTQPQPQPQPPVYNINKNDFRDVVQKLTGSPAHHTRLSSPPAAPSPAPPRPVLSPTAAGGTSSRLQKIRPPPLAQFTPRPPPPLGPAAANYPLPQTAGDASGISWGRSTPLSPLPPFPTVSAAAESPITAYMRCLRSGSVPHQQALIPSPRGGYSSGALLPLAPSSPLSFSCVPSSMMLQPGLLFPPSPTPSPK